MLATPMVERIALHQTRLHTPGLGLDAKGVALGTKGLVLLPSIDRLVMLLAAYTREHSLESLMPTLAMHVAKSKLGTREITLEFAAESSDRMDRMAATARLVGGFTFTGTSRHFVQYRDSAAPFGYDAKQLLSTDAALALYSDRFSQTYDLERRIDLRALLLRLTPRVDPSTKLEPGLRILVAEQGLGPAVVRYLVRSRVEGEACVAEWPPDSALEDAPVQRWVVRIPILPDRMRPLVHATPGITCFVPAGQGVAVEGGYRHPVELRACPVFDAAGLVLLRGRGDDPWIVERLPPMGALSAFARVEMRTAGGEAAVAQRTVRAEAIRVPLRVMPSSSPWRNVTATWVPLEQLPLLRRLAYALPHATIAQARIATTTRGAFVRSKAGIEAIPLGTFFVELCPNLYVPAGCEVTPAVAPEVLARAFDASASQVLFIGTDARAWAVEEDAFITLETALLEAPPWESVVAQSIERTLSEAAIDLRVTSVGLLPTLGVEPPAKVDG
jgi:FtsH ternary system-associated peptide